VKDVASIIDVARMARVSPATVSRVLNGTAGVSPERAERVRAAVTKLQYQPFGPARALRKQLTDVWAVIVADVENPFFTSVVRGIEDGAQEFGRRVLLCNSDEDLAKEAGYIDVAVAERVGGVVISVASTRQSDLSPLLAQGIPVVAVDRRPVGAKVDSVLVDNRLAAKQATEHLIEGGGEHIACITGPKRISTANERLRGYHDALTEAGLDYDESLVMREDFRQPRGHKAVAELFAGRRQPDALFVANNEMTVGALQGLQELGLRIPDDVAVAGFDDTPWATLIRPSLTVVSQPTYDIGRAAAELLSTANQVTDGRRRELVLPAKLIVRESSTRARVTRP
jgi:LacI family transcriptional regulator